MSPERTFRNAVATVVATGLLVASPAAAGPIKLKSSQKLDLTVGKSIVIESPVALGRASLADADVADALVLSPRQVYVSGKAIGSTNLTLWRQDDSIYSVFDVQITPDLTGLKQRLHQIFPEEKHLSVNAAHDHVTLAGAISSPVKMQRALAVAEAFAPEKVVNLMQVGGNQQVMLEVRVAEMSRSLMRRLGVNIAYTGNNGTDFGVTSLNDLTAVTAPQDATLLPNYETLSGAASAVTPFGLVPLATNAILRWQDGGADWTAFFDALKENGLVKILAEPNLVSLSGQEASFLAGGEFPFPVPQTLGTVTIEFKKFGVGLVFTPTVLSENLISVEVAPEVSELDFSNAITISGFLIPAITTRRASTVVEMKDGQSFAIAGLIRESVREQVSKFPFLGDVPVLGTLFRSTDYQRNESELIIVVTPRLVKPSEERIPLPTDGFVEPNDFDWYVMGTIEVPPRPGTHASASGADGMMKVEHPLEGDFGHVEP